MAAQGSKKVIVTVPAGNTLIATTKFAASATLAGVERLAAGGCIGADLS